MTYVNIRENFSPRVVGRKIADVDLQGLPHLGSGITWDYKGHPVLATPNLKKGEVSIIDMKTWKTIKRLQTLGPGFFMRSHENTPYAWVDVFFGKNRDVMHIIDKRTLEIVKTLRPQPGKTAAHIEFDRYGKYAILSIWDMNGAIVIYDAKTLKEVKRIPMKNRRENIMSTIKPTCRPAPVIRMIIIRVIEFLNVMQTIPKH